MNNIDFVDFLKVDIRVGTVLEVSFNEKARQPAYVLEVDFGSEIGKKITSAQLVENYKKNDLIGTQVLAVVNFPVKRVAGVKSEVLVLAVVDEEKGNVLLRVDDSVKNGMRVF